MLLELLEYVMKIIFSYLISDFIMGVYHWIKDTYFTPFTPIIGKKFIWGSRLHHVRPRYVTEISDIELIVNSAIWTFLWIGPLMYLCGINIIVVIMFILISLNDVIHKYAHMRDIERPKIVTFFQKNKLLQSHDEHHLHHISPHDVNYCPITPYVNVLLENINFWRRCENVIYKLTGIPPRQVEFEFIENPNYPAGIEFINKFTQFTEDSV